MTFVCYDGSLGTIMINNENNNVTFRFTSASVLQLYSATSLIFVVFPGVGAEWRFYAVISLVARTKDHN